MKIPVILLIAIACLTMTGTAQVVMPQLPIDETSGRITYTEVVTIDSSVSRDELYSRGREWFAKTYNSANDVIQMQDREAGKIVGRALLTVYHKGLGMTFESGNIGYEISLAFKDGRYKYEMTDFIHTSNYESGRIKTPCDEMLTSERKAYRKYYAFYLEQLDANMKTLINDLKLAMDTQSVAKGKRDEDW